MLAMTGRDAHKEFREWLQMQEIAEAKKKNGWWRNFWTEYGGDLVFVATVLGALTIFVAIYLVAETAGWFRL